MEEPLFINNTYTYIFIVLSAIVVILSIICKQKGIHYPFIHVWQIGYLTLYSKNILTSSYLSQCYGLAFSNLLIFNPISLNENDL